MPNKRVYNSTTPKLVHISTSLILCVLALCNTGQSQIPNERIFSETVGLQFYNIAQDFIQDKDMTVSNELSANSEQISRSKEALLFLYATTLVDSRASYVFPEVLNITSRLDPLSTTNTTEMSFLPDSLSITLQMLLSYTDSSADFFVLRDTVENVLAQLNSREEREQFIQSLLAFGLRGKNKRFDSYLITKLGFYSAEKPDVETAIKYLLEAYNLYTYNHLAFSKLAELVPDQIQPVLFLQELRLKAAENPLDLTVALDYAHFAENLELYDIAAGAYSYCGDLFAYLYPSENLPSSIYLPWALSFYNTERNQYKCVQKADAVRQTGRFDLMLEAIAAKAAEKVGDMEKSNQLFLAAEQTALRQYIETPNQIMLEQLAWFYSFANIQPMKALDWANKAFSNDPNSMPAASLLAYTLVENGQTDLAKNLIDNYPSNQITDLTAAKIAKEQGNTELFIEHLNSAIKKDPASLEAELAKQLLAQQGSQYLSGIDAELTQQVLEGNLNMSVVPQFITPQDIISFNIDIRGSKFSYGTVLDGHIVIANNSTQPLIISDYSLFKGNIRIDATITGDIDATIPNLINKRIIQSSPIQPKRNLLIPFRLSKGQLKKILKTFPQASLEIEFKAYIDPVIDLDGNISNSIKDIPPATTTISRTSVELTRRYLQNRLDSMGTGRQGQKIQTAQLFIGLLQEQNAMSNQSPLYEFMYADWMPELLKSALIETLSDRDWNVKCNTMADMLSLSLDYELTNAVAENLNDTKWPVRFMALYLLAQNQGSEFNKVLNWHAEHDMEAIVRAMAIALGGKPPETQTPPEPQPKPQEESSLDSYLENILDSSRSMNAPPEVPAESQKAPQQ